MALIRMRSRCISVSEGRTAPPRRRKGSKSTSGSASALSRSVKRAHLAPFFLALPAHRLARRILGLEPHVRRPAAVGSIRPL